MVYACPKHISINLRVFYCQAILLGQYSTVSREQQLNTTKPGYMKMCNFWKVPQKNPNVTINQLLFWEWSSWPLLRRARSIHSVSRDSMNSPLHRILMSFAQQCHGTLSKDEKQIHKPNMNQCTIEIVYNIIFILYMHSTYMHIHFSTGWFKGSSTNIWVNISPCLATVYTKVHQAHRQQQSRG